MNNLTTNITSYDFLGMFIPGSIGMSMIVYKCFTEVLHEKVAVICCGCKVSDENTMMMTTIEILMFFACAYILGLIINWLSDGIWRGFRNNSAFIVLQAQKLVQRNPNYRLILHDLHLELSNNDVNSYASQYMNCLKLMFRDIRDMWSDYFKKKPITRYSFVEIRYYDIYYWLLEHNKISSASIVESQVTLLRNMLLVLLCSMIICLIGTQWLCVSTLFATLICMFFTMVSRQNRIYSIILEDYQNYKEMEAV